MQPSPVPRSPVGPGPLSTEQDNMKLIFQTLLPHLNKKRFHYLPAFCPLTYGHMVRLHQRLSSQALGPLGISLCWREAESPKPNLRNYFSRDKSQSVIIQSTATRLL